MKHDPLDGSRQDIHGNEDHARRREDRDVLAVDPPGRAEDLTALTLPSQGVRIRRPPRGARRGGEHPDQCQKHEGQKRHRMHQRPIQRERAVGYRAAEEVTHAQTERRAARDLDARVAQAVRPLDRGGPLLLRTRPGWAIVDACLSLAPAPVEPKPCVRRRRGRRDVRQQNGLGFQSPCGVASVVTTEPLARASSEEQSAAEVVGVRPGRVIDDRVRRRLLQLGVSPPRSLPARVLGQVDLVRAHPQRLGHTRRREVDLCHLPVTLVLVGEVVEPSACAHPLHGGHWSLQCWPARLQRWPVSRPVCSCLDTAPTTGS